MDVVTLQAAKAAAKRSYAALKTPQRVRDLPGMAVLPLLASAPPAVTLSAAGAASGIASATPVPWDRPGAFAYLGADPSGAANDGYCGMFGVYSYHDQPWWAVEFDLETVLGTFDILLKGNGSKARLWIDGQLVTAGPTVTTVNDNAAYLLTVAGTAGTHRVRVGFDGPQRFGGVNVGPTDTVQATRVPRPRFVIAGDSYTLPTILDTGTPCYDQGFASLFGLMIGADVRILGKGSRGYVKTDPTYNKTFADPAVLAELIAQAPDAVLWFGSLNDQTFGATGAQVQAAALTAFQAVKAALPACELIACGPTWYQGSSYFPAQLLQLRDGIKASIAAAGGTFLDILSKPVPSNLGAPYAWTFATTVNSHSDAGAPLVLTAAPPVGAYIQVGNGSNAEIRRVFTVVGAGPYTVTPASNAFLRAHEPGEPVILCGNSWLTGSGKQTVPVGDGNADRYLGSDATHLTIAGNMALAKFLYWQYMRTRSA